MHGWHALTGTIFIVMCVLFCTESDAVQVDETGEKVRPMQKRSILILREIPDETPIEVITVLTLGER
jgi:hypothetical protein